MNRIEKIGFVIYENSKDFYENITNVVNDHQKEGLTVEIQYSTTNIDCSAIFSALIIGRKEVK